MQRKPKIPNVNVNVLFPEGMYELITEVAAGEDRTISWIVRRAVQEYLVNHDYLDIDDLQELSEFCGTDKLRKPNGYNKDKEN